MTRLSVNINKIATIRNARGGNLPDVAKAAVNCERFGAEGITVHPRPDERHIRYADVREIRPLVRTEFNIEGNPIPSFVDLVLEVVPDQVTLVPDAHDAITSNAGWNTLKHKDFLTDICARFKAAGIRTSIFIDPDPPLLRDGEGGPVRRSRPERGPRPQPGQPRLFHPDHSLDGRGFNRPRADQRCPLYGPGENNSGISWGNQEKISIFVNYPQKETKIID